MGLKNIYLEIKKNAYECKLMYTTPERNENSGKPIRGMMIEI